MVYVVGKAGRQDWQHVYTAVTRGRGRVYVIAEEPHLRSAILRNNVRRKTRLRHFLQDQLSMSCASPAEFASPSKGSEDGRGPSTQPAASPPPAAPADTVTDSVPRSQFSAADWMFASAEGWKLPPSEKADAGQEPSPSRGCKRAGVLMDTESPSKVPMVGALLRVLGLCLDTLSAVC